MGLKRKGFHQSPSLVPLISLYWVAVYVLHLTTDVLLSKIITENLKNSFSKKGD
ncbi:hypothetical protein QY96_02119 [Bacillus thermotolerans]|uniref:Uncharacterized protein n=1 Tax=Bacillus thermotolerans TaxID=1221996 RepID=A0A0F5HMS9_BACTR|nr:hypothetical protein QY95_03966 [Bacillus thermotolerans]KKB41099.1 hypothetical protein QY96_02119 [Bacillus thermotolerans]